MILEIRGASKDFKVEVDPSGTVRSLKKAISKEEGCRVSQIRLIYSGQVLKSNRLLSTIRFEPNVQIDMIIDEDETKSEPRPVVADPEIDKQALNQEFLRTISESPWKEKLGNRGAQFLIENLIRFISELSGLGIKGYDEVLERLKMIETMSSRKPASPTPPPSMETLEDRFARQLSEMEAMGIGDRNTNLEALRLNDGNVDNAVEWLIENGKLG